MHGQIGALAYATSVCSVKHSSFNACAYFSIGLSHTEDGFEAGDHTVDIILKANRFEPRMVEPVALVDLVRHRSSNLLPGYPSELLSVVVRD